MQIDEARPCEARAEVVAARADALEEAAPAFARHGGEIQGWICPVSSSHSGGVLVRVVLAHISRSTAAGTVMAR